MNKRMLGATVCHEAACKSDVAPGLFASYNQPSSVMYPDKTSFYEKAYARSWPISHEFPGPRSMLHTSMN